MKPPERKIPYGFCKCGCGQKTNTHPWGIRKLGIKLGDPYDFVAGHRATGKRITIKPLREKNEARIMSLYALGQSIRQIALALGISYGYVGLIVQESGLSRTISAANRIRQPMKPTKHWRSSRTAARKIYQRHYNVQLTRTQHVHHIDGDHTNNEISNLTVMNAGDHARYHIAKYWEAKRGMRAKM